MNKNLKTLRILVVMTALLLAGLTAALLLRPAPPNAGPVPLSGQGLQLGGDFTLQSSKGPFALSDLRGYPTVLFFGYTSCPDVCPASLAIMAQGFNRLSEARQARVRGLFISVDPARDTPEKLATYSAFFHPNLIGLTGSRDEIDAVVKRYGAYYRITQLDDSALEYTVDHSSRLYLIDDKGAIAEVLGDSITPDELAQKLIELL